MKQLLLKIWIFIRDLFWDYIFDIIVLFFMLGFAYLLGESSADSGCVVLLGLSGFVLGRHSS